MRENVYPRIVASGNVLTQMLVRQLLKAKSEPQPAH
jgi:hypothetical protein